MGCEKPISETYYSHPQTGLQVSLCDKKLLVGSFVKKGGV